MIPCRSTLNELMRHVDGSHGVTVIGVSRRGDHRLGVVSVLRVELYGLRKTSQRAKPFPARCVIHLPRSLAPFFSSSAALTRSIRGADQIDLSTCPRARSCDGAEFRTP